MWENACKKARHEDGMHYPEIKAWLDTGNHVAKGPRAKPAKGRGLVEGTGVQGGEGDHPVSVWVGFGQL